MRGAVHPVEEEEGIIAQVPGARAGGAAVAAAAAAAAAEALVRAGAHQGPGVVAEGSQVVQTKPPKAPNPNKPGCF